MPYRYNDGKRGPFVFLPPRIYYPVVTFDDLQWGDMASARLLAHFLGPPEPPPILFIAVYRRDEAESGDRETRADDHRPVRLPPQQAPDDTAVRVDGRPSRAKREGEQDRRQEQQDRKRDMRDEQDREQRARHPTDRTSGRRQGLRSSRATQSPRGVGSVE